MIFLLLFLLADGSRTVDSVIPSLVYSDDCSTAIELRNLGDRAVEARVEAHRESGSLAALDGEQGMSFHLEAGEQRSLKLHIPESTADAWVRVRELVPAEDLSPVLAVSATVACIAGQTVRSTAREVAYPLRNPWFDGDIGEMAGAHISVVNVSETPATAFGCYSSGTLVSNPNVPGAAPVLFPLCNLEFQEQIPPFSARRFSVQHGSNSHFGLRVQGAAAALQMFRLLDAGTQLYEVDSKISFGAAAARP